MEKEIKQIIEEQLPKQVGEVLQKRLTNLEEKEKELIKVTEDLNASQKEVARLRVIVGELDQYKATHLSLQKLKDEVDEKSRELKINTLEYQLQSEKEKSEFVSSVCLGLTRNLEYRKGVFNTTSKPVSDQYGNISYQNRTTDLTETKTIE